MERLRDSAVVFCETVYPPADRSGNPSVSTQDFLIIALLATCVLIILVDAEYSASILSSVSFFRVIYLDQTLFAEGIILTFLHRSL